ncbi:hypothetical protein MK489_18260 [Myxococcota bacterium]|nr:hypothetical protein [Myxococcota bacterium]
MKTLLKFVSTTVAVIFTLSVATDAQARKRAKTVKAADFFANCISGTREGNYSQLVIVTHDTHVVGDATIGDCAVNVMPGVTLDYSRGELEAGFLRMNGAHLSSLQILDTELTTESFSVAGFENIQFSKSDATGWSIGLDATGVKTLLRVDKSNLMAEHLILINAFGTKTSETAVQKTHGFVEGVPCCTNRQREILDAMHHDIGKRVHIDRTQGAGGKILVTSVGINESVTKVQKTTLYGRTEGEDTTQLTDSVWDDLVNKKSLDDAIAFDWRKYGHVVVHNGSPHDATMMVEMSEIGNGQYTTAAINLAAETSNSLVSKTIFTGTNAVVVDGGVEESVAKVMKNTFLGCENTVVRSFSDHDSTLRFRDNDVKATDPDVSVTIATAKSGGNSVADFYKNDFWNSSLIFLGANGGDDAEADFTKNVFKKVDHVRLFSTGSFYEAKNKFGGATPEMNYPD